MKNQNHVSPYGQPTLDSNRGAMAQQVIVNQPVRVIDPKIFSTVPIALSCMFCHKPVTTQVKTTCNYCACLLCWFTFLAFYAIVQCCRGKDCCCYDAEHRCPHCGNVVGTYTAC